MQEIIIDEYNKKLLQDLQKEIADLQYKMNLICAVILNREKAEGIYHLNEDCSKLIKCEDVGGANK